MTSSEEFQLDPRLEADTVRLGRLPLCLVLLSRDARYPWLVLVPQRPGLREIYELTAAERAQFVEESSACARLLGELERADKINVAALGNVVAQLHVHHVARFRTDAAWPGPIWGAHPPLAYTDEALRARVTRLREALASVPGFQPA